MIKALKQNFFIVLLLLISVMFFHSILSTGKIWDNVHYINDMTFLSYNVKQSVLNEHTLHLWTPYFYSGQPLMAIPESYLFDLNFIYVVLFRNIYLAMNLAAISYFFIAGAGMYFMSLSFVKDKKAAFISSIVYMFNGFFFSFIIGGHLNILESYALIPLVLLFVSKAIRESPVKNSIFAGIFLAMQVLAGGIIFFIYAVFFSFLMIIFYCIGGSFIAKAKKSLAIGIIFLIVGLGLSAIKLLPSLEYTSLSSRASSVSFQEFLGNPVTLSNPFYLIVSYMPLHDSSISGAVTIIGAIFLLFSLQSARKRYVAFFILAAILSLILAGGGSLGEFFYKFIPGFGKMRHIERALVIFAVSSSILVGAGYLNLAEWAKKFNFAKKIPHLEKIVLVLFLLLFFSEVFYFNQFPHSVEIVKPENIPILDYLKEDKSLFRTANLALKTLIGGSGYNYYAQFGVSEVKGGGGIWMNDYVKYLAIGEQYNPEKFYGMLNAKYYVSDFRINRSSVALVREFQKCTRNCGLNEPWGPYLYRNKEHAPRFYIVNNSALVLGEKANADKLVYPLLLSNFNPLNSVILSGDLPENYETDELKKFSAIILAQPPKDYMDIEKLSNYKKTGGILLPDIVSGKNSLSNEDVFSLFRSFSGGYEEKAPKIYSSRKIILEIKKEDLKHKNNFLVLSEQFAAFSGWSAKLNGNNAKIYPANGVLSAIYLSGPGTLEISYLPKSFIYGLFISAIVLSLILLYFLKAK